MNKYAVGLLCCCVYVAGYTQVIPSATLRRSVVQSLDVAVRSQQVNLQAQRALLRLFEPSLMESQVFSEHPEPFQRAVFQVQKSPMSHSTASAFAVEFEDEWWGVTAAHVINNIQADPYMRVKNHYGKELFFPIEQWHSANRNGSDVAVFKIPYEAKPFIQVLPVAKTPAKAGTASHILSFVKRGPLFAQEEVLFSGPYRLLLRDETHREMTGFCGSPVLVDGKVVGLNVGFYTQHDLQLVSWNQLLRNMSPQTIPALHQAAPIEQAIRLIREMKTRQRSQGTTLYVMGFPVAVLQSDQQLFSIQQRREGRALKQIHVHPFLDFNKLEQFFELQENDILRITVLQPKTATDTAHIHMYDINVSTGEISRPLEDLAE